MSAEFILDATLAADSVAVAALPVSEVRLIDDSRFPWLIMVPRRAGAIELIDLDKAERALVMEEIAGVSTALKAVTGCHKLNVAALGNAVRQLHIHVVARFREDAAWPGPVWGVGKAVAYKRQERDRLVELIRSSLPT